MIYNEGLWILAFTCIESSALSTTNANEQWKEHLEIRDLIEKIEKIQAKTGDTWFIIVLKIYDHVIICMFPTIICPQWLN